MHRLAQGSDGCRSYKVAGLQGCRVAGACSIASRSVTSSSLSTRVGSRAAGVRSPAIVSIRSVSNEPLDARFKHISIYEQLVRMHTLAGKYSRSGF